MQIYRLIFIYLSLLSSLILNANTIDVSLERQEILEGCYYFVTTEDKTLQEVQSHSLIQRADRVINLAFNDKAVIWVKLELNNPSNKVIQRVLEVENPMLSKVVLHDDGTIKIAGVSYIQKDQDHLNAAFFLTFKAHEKRTLWLSVENRRTTLQFELFIKSPKVFYHDDLIKQMFMTLLIGGSLALLLLSLVVAAYTQNSSYLYYTFYLTTLIYRQVVYSGLLQLHVPQSVTDFNDAMNMPMAVVVIVAASGYAMNFLETSRYYFIHKIYKLFIVMAMLQLPFLTLSTLYLPETIVLTGLTFMLFSIYSGYYIYRQGDKQARFFIAGWIILIPSYLLLILDSLGIYVTSNLSTLLMFSTGIEALLLLLAYLDLFTLVEEEKEELAEALIQEHKLRQKLIEEEVSEKTETLSKVIEQKELLYRELHHRVKNNLQLILSILRLQHRYSKNEIEHSILKQYESRIGAIARVHELLYHRSDEENVDMLAYVQEYIDGMHLTLDELKIQLYCEVDAHLPLRESVYVGLIINELVSNAIKHAYGEEGGAIYITLSHENEVYCLEVRDEGRGYSNHLAEVRNLGSRLIETLVQMQLDGSIELDDSQGTHYKIRFSL